MQQAFSNISSDFEAEAAGIEEQRRELRQFVIVLRKSNLIPLPRSRVTAALAECCIIASIFLYGS
jgi:hypothetical protein